MKLTLVRHGSPVDVDTKRIGSSELGHWIADYNQAPLRVDSRPSIELSKMAGSANAIVCSDMRRSVESAVLFDVDAPLESDPIFREAGLPYGGVPFVKLRPAHWAIVFRIGWLFGYSRNSESFTAFRVRTIAATKQLEKIVEEHEDVLFVGHAILNSQISKCLLRAGWRGTKPTNGHWSFGTFERVSR